MLHYGYLASASTNVLMNTVDGVATSVTRGFFMPRAGWIVSHSVTLNVTSVSGGSMELGVLLDSVIQTPTVIALDQTGNDQSDSSTFAPIRFGSGGKIAAGVIRIPAITYEAITGMIEVELDR